MVCYKVHFCGSIMVYYCMHAYIYFKARLLMLENSRVHSRNNTLFYYIEALDFANTKGLAVACTAALGLPNLNWD